MHVSLRRVVAGAALLGTAAGIAYTALALARIRAFRNGEAAGEPANRQPVTVLKPLHGAEPDLYQNLRSFCEQRYPEYQILFCSADPDDPALDTVRRLQGEFPQLDIAVATGRAQRVRNPKIGNLLGAIELAKHALLIIADSDIRVDPEYLNAVAACFDDPAVGAATCLYGGVPSNDLPSRLGAMYVNDQFAPSVLVAAALEPLTYCFGATMAVRANVLHEIGGLAALAGHLGDDYRLGNLVARAGYRVALSSKVVQTSVHERNWRSLWLHEVRWARTIRSQRPAGYAGSIVTYPLVFAAIFAVFSGSAYAGALMLAVTAALRVLLHEEARKTFAPQTQASPGLVPVRDGLGAGVWCAGLSGRRVAWREQDYAVDANGRLLDNPGQT